MQLLPHGTQELPRIGQFPPDLKSVPQRKTASEKLIDHQELLPMRLAQVRAGMRRRSAWNVELSRSW